ncbi:MAG: hypothetical protein K0B09_10700 [Bacteroidales bacterium]|nr:hypothetical protein [Bacteroidales bacterium]
MKTLIFSTLLFAATAAFSSSHTAELSFRNFEAKESISLEISSLQKPEVAEELPAFIMKVQEVNKTKANDDLICVINQIRKPELEEELPAFMM